MDLPSLTRPEFYTKLIAFCALVEAERNAKYTVSYPSLVAHELEAGKRGYGEIGYDDGQRFVKVWEVTGGCHTSICYFIEKDTGIIFGSNGWKKYNPARAYGTLDTMADWEWSEYDGVSKFGVSTLVPKSHRR